MRCRAVLVAVLSVVAAGRRTRPLRPGWHRRAGDRVPHARRREAGGRRHRLRPGRRRPHPRVPAQLLRLAEVRPLPRAAGRARVDVRPALLRALRLPARPRPSRCTTWRPPSERCAVVVRGGCALVGASMGGSIAVVAAARLPVEAVVSLSGERDTTGLTPGINAHAGAAARGVRAPALFVVARRDPYVSPAETRTMARRARSARAIVLPAVAGHGWGMLDGLTAEWSPLAGTVAAFIRRHAR